MRRLCILVCLVACGDDAPLEDRLIQSNDRQFGELERPESVGECASSSECVDNCLHSCTPDSVQPMTCPVTPVPLPSRLVGATCACDAEACKWL
jgi:hypothetical protein